MRGFWIIVITVAVAAGAPSAVRAQAAPPDAPAAQQPAPESSAPPACAPAPAPSVAPPAGNATNEPAKRATSTADDQKIFSKYFKLEVKGIYGAVPGVTSVDPGRLTVTTEEATQGDKPEYRTYTYGTNCE